MLWGMLLVEVVSGVVGYLSVAVYHRHLQRTETKPRIVRQHPLHDPLDICGEDGAQDRAIKIEDNS